MGADLLQGRLSFIGIATGQNDLGAELGELYGGHPADAAVAAGNEYAFAFQCFDPVQPVGL